MEDTEERALRVQRCGKSEEGFEEGTEGEKRSQL